jgi:hypothetical protein
MSYELQSIMIMRGIHEALRPLRSLFQDLKTVIAGLLKEISNHLARLVGGLVAPINRVAAASQAGRPPSAVGAIIRQPQPRDAGGRFTAYPSWGGDIEALRREETSAFQESQRNLVDGVLKALTTPRLNFPEDNVVRTGSSGKVTGTPLPSFMEGMKGLLGNLKELTKSSYVAAKTQIKSTLMTGVHMKLMEWLGLLLDPLLELMDMFTPIVEILADIFRAFLMPVTLMIVGLLNQIMPVLTSFLTGVMNGTAGLAQMGQFLVEHIIAPIGKFFVFLGGVIAWFAGCLWNGLVKVIDLVDFLDVLPTSGWYVQAPLPAWPFAQGGTVLASPGGTLALLGEAGQDEHVIRGDRMEELIAAVMHLESALTERRFTI